MVRARVSRAKTCLFLPDVLIQCFNQSFAEDLAGYGEQSGVSPVAAVTQITHLSNLTLSPVLYATGIILPSHISLKTYIKRRGVSVSSALSNSTVTPSAPHAFPLFIALMAALTSSMVGESMQISKSSTAGGISATCSDSGLFRILSNAPSSVQASLLLSKEHCHLCLLQGHCCF